MESKPADANTPSLGSEGAVPQDPSSVSLLSSSTYPTFSIQIPFILLGTPNVPEYIYNHAGRKTRPLEAIQYLIKDKCAGFEMNLWIPKELDKNDIQPPGANRAETLQKIQQRREELEEEESRRWEAVKERGWIIRHGAGQHRRGWLGRWKDGDGKLTARDLRVLPENIWNVPIVLQRFDVDIRMKDKVMGELNQMMDVLGSTFNDGNVGKEGVMKIVCSHNCKLKLAVQPPEGVWDIKTASKVLLALAGLERELLTTDTMTGVLSYIYLSRFMTHYEIRQLKKERRRIWDLRGVKKANFDFEKNEWEKEVQQEDIWDTTDELALWNKLSDFVKEGDWKIAEFIRAMERCEERGSGMAVSLPIALSVPDATFGEEKQSHEDSPAPEHPETTKRDEDHQNSVRETMLRRSSTPAPSMPEPFRGIESVVFQSHRSSLDIKDIFAYTDLVTRLIHHVVSIPYSELETWIGSFRWSVTSLEEIPLQALNRLYRWLDVAPSTQRYYSDLCIRRELTRSGKNFEQLLGDDDTFDMKVPGRTPFYQFVKLLEKEKKREWLYIPIFISRYMDAGGFNVVTRPKLYALMTADDRKRKVKEGA